jgi:hypothetical protein
MSERIRIVCYTLWIAHPVLQMAIAIVMLRRGQHRAYKWFFVYIIAQILLFAALFPIYVYWDSAWFYATAFDAVVGAVLGLMVIRAAFFDVFRPFHTLRDLGKVAFRWALLIMCLVAGVIAVSTRSPHTALTQAIMTGWTCVRSVEVGMALFLLILARYVGVNWRQHSFGIALGFATLAVVELALIASWAGYRLGGVSVSLVNVGTYTPRCSSGLATRWRRVPPATPRLLHRGRSTGSKH